MKEPGQVCKDGICGPARLEDVVQLANGSSSI